MKNNLLKFLKLSMFICLLTLSNTSHALQIKEVVSDGEFEAFIAADELSRIKAIGDRVLSVKSNEGEIEIVEDTRLGEIYIRPVRSNQEPINIFVTTEKNHVYKLLLLPKRMPSEQIFIKNIEAIVEEEKKEELSHRDEIIDLIETMIVEQFNYPENTNYPNREINNHNLVSKFAFMGTDLIGEVAEFTNETTEELKISPEQFYEGGILALSLDKELLEPGEKTNIYIVREVIHG